MKALLLQFCYLGRSLIILLACLMVGQGLQRLTGLPVPASILGLLLLFSLLSSKLISLDYVLPASNILLKYITLLFVPLGVGLVRHTELLSKYWLAIGLSSLASTLVILLSVGWCYQRFGK